MRTKSVWNEPNKRFYKFLKNTEKYNLDKNILVIGCSDGTYAIPAARKGFNVLALDIDKDAIYGSKPILIGDKYVENIGLKERLKRENLCDKVRYEVCDYMDWNSDEKYSLIFTSGSIHYAFNNKHTIDDMIYKMIDMLCDNGILLLEYIHEDENTDKNRYFVSKSFLENILKRKNNIKIISHKVKTYVEQANPRDNKVHTIKWGRIYVQKLPSFVDDTESAKYYDVLPRFSKKVYDYLEKEMNMTNKKIADVGCGTGRIAIDLLEKNNIVYAIDPDKNMLNICINKCSKYNNVFHPIVGTDISMNISSKSVDYVVVSQSFHRFNPPLFKKECKRVLKQKGKVIIIWYRVDFKNKIFSQMLSNVKECYENYETRYGSLSEVDGAILEEKENIKSVADFFENNYNIKEIMSKASLDIDEFKKLGLSMELFPIAHSLTTVTKIINSKVFDKEKYISNLEKIFKENSINNKIELSFRVQVISNKGEL